MDPLKLLKMELYSDDIAVVLASLRRLEMIALALGPQRSRLELLPLLASYAALRNAEDIATDNAAAAASGAECAGASPLMETFDRVVSDEALSVIGEQLGELASSIVGIPVASILPMLEALMQADETCIREAAVRGTSRVIELSQPQTLTETILPVCQRLAAATWFSGRCSAAQLIVPIYKRLASDQAKSSLRVMVANLCKDDTPMVRKCAFAAVSELCGISGATFLRSDLVMSLRALCEEEQDAFRLYIVDAAINIAKSVDELNNKELAIPLIEEASADSSWRVRRHLAKNFSVMCQSSTNAIQSHSLMLFLPRLFQDVESEVRTMIVSQMVEIAKVVGPELTTKFIAPSVKDICSDQCEETRIALAKAIIPFTVHVEKAYLRSDIMPIVLGLLNDASADIRCYTVENLEQMNKSLTVDEISTLVIPIISTMSIDLKWRIRMSVLSKIASFSKLTGPQVYESKLHDILFHGIADTVFEVRHESASQIKLLIQNFGVDWAKEKLMPQVMAFFETSTNYLHRMIPLQVIGECASLFKSDYNTAIMLPILVSASKDHIANVRIITARTLALLLPYVDATVQREKVKPVLSKLKEDSDPDVKFFAESALARAV